MMHLAVLAVELGEWHGVAELELNHRGQSVHLDVQAVNVLAHRLDDVRVLPFLFVEARAQKETRFKMKEQGSSCSYIFHNQKVYNRGYFQARDKLDVASHPPCATPASWTGGQRCCAGAAPAQRRTARVDARNHRI